MKKTTTTVTFRPDVSYWINQIKLIVMKIEVVPGPGDYLAERIYLL